MGLFSNRCEALVDPKTRKALTGEALQEARRVKGSPTCGYRVSKKARNCSQCGAGAPGGWVRCSACNKWVGNESNFCPHCNNALHPDTRADLAGGVWQKDGAMFAQRFEVGDVARLLKQENLQVQEGTMALLLDGGKYVKHLDAGRHNPASLARTINWFGHPPPRSVVLVDAGDVRLSVIIEGLRSAEKIPVDFAGDIVVRFEPKRADDFLANVLKEKREYTYESLGNLLGGEIRSAVEAFCIKTPMADLAFDPERRKRLADELQAGLKIACERLGIGFVYVATADFTGEEYEQLVKAEASLVLKRKEIEFTQAARELLSRDRMHEFKTEADLKNHLESLAHEYRITDAHRQREEVLLLKGWERQDDLSDLQHRLNLEMTELRHAFDVERLKRNDSIESKRLELEIAGLEKQRKAMEVDSQIDEATKWLRVRELKDEIKLKRKAADALRRKGMTTAERLQDEEDPAVRAALLQLKEIEANAQAASSDAQRAVLEKEAQMLREMLERADKAAQDARAHDQKMAEIWVEPASKAADRKGEGGTNIIK